MKLGLQAKAMIGLLAIGVGPLIVSVVLVKQVALVAQSVAIGEAERLHGALDRAREAYVEAVDARKQAFRHAGEEVAERPALRDLCIHGEAIDPRPLLEAELDHDAQLVAITLRRGGADAGVARRPLDPGQQRLTLNVEHPLAEAPACAVALTYATDRGATLAADFESMGQILGEHRQLEQIRRSLPPTYRVAFALWVGGFATLATAIAIVFARRTTRRIDQLVRATRRVGEGDLETRVAAASVKNDELGDLARAFDDMVGLLAGSRAEIEYLQKIGAWQEVARRLAHEIKNPLTPIQLAVQELQKQYAGDDPRFRKMLDDSVEIVGEEIAGLRRLVDAFSGFAKLPRVEPRPLDLGVVVEDVTRDLPAGGLTVEVSAPPAPVTVAGDRLLLRRALTNLVDNAREAGARRVSLAWSVTADGALLAVEDDGPGVPPAMATTLFDPYVTSKAHGTGLGLAIVKKTILEHGGTIELVSGSALGGARFEVRLPLGVVGEPET